MLRKEIETIIFDVDGTLNEEVSQLKASWFGITEGLGASLNKHVQIFADFKAGKLSYPEAKRQLISLWQSTGNANKAYMEKMFHSWSLKDDAQETINFLKRRGYRVCLISGAVDLYVQIVAGKLGVADWYANTELVWDGEGNLIDFHYYSDQAQRKLEQLEEYLSKYSLDRQKCAVVGDGDSDIVLFKELPYGIAVNKEPYPELEALAYRTVSRLRQLRRIF